ncbi:DUF2269 family protein [Halorhodospira neutriphila]|uniref:DUF2269 domain-containing protein n=1 Tax=Halorhodospira neutriphila TaxID=168379 RepID=A0ABS1E3D7_9GAMM|nr:DUF2269 family protein [Halorhodospira neutriphila]MBK1725990.1 hypothetical protein [Halorhodospira neutriphila]
MLRKTLKILHTLGSIGLTGAVAVHLVLLGMAPGPEAIQEHAVIRSAIAEVSGWILLPSLAVVFLSGLLSMAFYRPFRNAGWVWLKAILSLSVFGSILIHVHGTAIRTAEATRAAADGEIPVDRIPQYVHNEALILWIILLVCIANVVLGVWRPRAERWLGPQRAARGAPAQTTSRRS